MDMNVEHNVRSLGRLYINQDFCKQMISFHDTFVQFSFYCTLYISSYVRKVTQNRIREYRNDPKTCQCQYEVGAIKH